MITNTALQKILKGTLHWKRKINIIVKAQQRRNPSRRIEKQWWRRGLSGRVPAKQA
jgi:hypothetical protein